MKRIRKERKRGRVTERGRVREREREIQRRQEEGQIDQQIKEGRK